MNWSKHHGIFMVFFLLLALNGCSLFNGNAVRAVRIFAEENMLETWKKELPPDIQASPVSAKAVRGLLIEKSGTPVFGVSYEPREYRESYDAWNLSFPYQSLVTVNTEELFGLFSILESLPLQAVTEQPAEPETGLKNPQACISIAYTGTSDESKMSVQMPDTIRKIMIGNQDSSGNYYALIEGNEQIYTMYREAAESLTEIDPYQYILKIPSLVNIHTVSDVTIDIGEKDFRLSGEGGQFKLDRQDIDEDTYNEIYSQLMGILIEKEIPRQTEHTGDGEAVLSITYYRNTEAAPDVMVRYYDYDEKYMAVEVNGTRFFLVSRQEVMKKIDFLRTVGTELSYIVSTLNKCKL